MITFVTFHVDFDRDSEDYLINSKVRLKEKVSFINKEFDHRAMIDTMFKSARLFHPECKCIVLTDNKTDISSLDSLVEIRRFEIDPRKIILSRLIAQIEYLKKYAAHDDLLFLDYDIILNGNLDHIFKQDFDIAVTYRESKKGMPINGGLLFVSGRRKERSLAFLERVHAIYMAQYANNDVWWGDQLALRDALKVNDFTANTVVDVDGVRVLILSCDEYNYYPAEGYRSILFELKNKKVLHFKDMQKKVMHLYWNSYLAERASGERKMFSAMTHKPLLLALMIKEMLQGFLRGGR
jgi:hypothetical protein